MSVQDHSVTRKPKHPPSPSVVHSQCLEPEEDFSDCIDLIRQIRPRELVQVANEVRDSQFPEAVSVSSVPHAGSFNLVYEIGFADGRRWAARIPKHGTVAKFGAAQATSMRYELELLRLIREQTQIPVPEVYHYDLTSNNPLGAPFSLCTWLDGVPASNLWHDDNGPTPLRERRMRILDSLAQAMARLNVMSCSMIGVPMAQARDEGAREFNVVEPLRARDPAKEMDWMIDHRDELGDEDGDPAIFYELGPFSSAADYLRALLGDSRTEGWGSDIQKGERRLLQIIIDAIDEIEKQKGGRSEFVLTHTDLDTQNVLINEDGSLTGILDWDGIHTGPKQMGYAAYPVLLTRDMSPWDYGYWSGDDEMKARETRPSELREMRKIYRSLFEKHAAAAAKDTVNSHLYRAVERACSQAHLTSAILCKLLRMCLPDRLPIDIEYERCGRTFHTGPGYDSDDDSSFASDSDSDDEDDEDDETEDAPHEADAPNYNDKEDKTASTLPLPAPDAEGTFRRKFDSSSASKHSIRRLASWIGLPFAVIKQFIAGWITKGRRRSSAMQSLLESQAHDIETTTVVAPQADLPRKTESPADLMDIDPPTQDQPAVTDDPEEQDEAEDEDSGEVDNSDASSEAGSNADSDGPPELPYNPNEYYPSWILNLNIALYQDTVSEEKIQILKHCFVDIFSSEEIVEEILPD